jgi:lipopolysaccharide/colanic/teichoic acid biosynthesis glycosyltransferase
MIYQRLVKELLDRVIASGLLLLLSPVIVLVTGLIWVKTAKNPIFTQSRPGYRERIFTLYKLKTMTDECDEHGQLLPDNQRTTTIGDWIRKYSLDELPQLWNVVKGDMSLVGPRPLLVQYLPLYNDYQRKRHLVKPGITGLAQVNGRNKLSWEEKFEFDVYYVEHISAWLDLKIVLLTFQSVWLKKGVNYNEDTTSTYFMGNPSESDKVLMKQPRDIKGEAST